MFRLSRISITDDHFILSRVSGISMTGTNETGLCDNVFFLKKKKLEFTTSLQIEFFEFCGKIQYFCNELMHFSWLDQRNSNSSSNKFRSNFWIIGRHVILKVKTRKHDDIKRTNGKNFNFNLNGCILHYHCSIETIQ